MCPMTAAAVATVAAAGVSAAGSISAGNSAKKAYDYNAQVSRERAQSELDAAAAEAMQIRTDVARKMGDAKAAYGASGVVLGSGSPLDVMSDLATQGELSTQLRLYEGKLRAKSAIEQANLDTMQGKAAQTAGYYGAAGSLLGGIGKVASMPGMNTTAPKVG